MADAPRLLFCSYHCYYDPSSGAALSTRDLLELLAARGWDCGVLCGPRLDFADGLAIDALLRRDGVPFQTRRAAGCAVHHSQLGGVRVSIVQPADAQAKGPPAPAAGPPFLALLDGVLDRFRPDVVLTYGGCWLADRIIRRVRERGLPVVFGLHNLEYHDAGLFRDVAAVHVPSQFAADHYRRMFGLECTPIPGPFVWERVQCERVETRYVTFVNPLPHKGVHVFARIAADLGARRPDIPLLVVEGRATTAWLGRGPLDLSGLTNLHRMANTPDPRDFYRVSRLILMPSLWQEAFGRVAAEAGMNGIPVLASRRGGLPEALAGSGFLFDVPARYTPHTTAAPSSAEVAPWVDAIIRLSDDAPFYQAHAELARSATQAWRPEELLPRFEALLRRQMKSDGVTPLA